MHRKLINVLIKWLENTVKMCLLLTILRLESIVEAGVCDLENELFFYDHSPILVSSLINIDSLEHFLI